MEQFLAFSLKELPFVAITLIIAFTVHEFAHAYTAYKFGDETAKKQGRLTLNPIQHLDPLGTILIFIAGFGWARPVPVNRFFFKRPRLAGIAVSIAGPASNFVMAAIGFFIWYALIGPFDAVSKLPPAIPEFLNMFIHLNLVLFVFNLLPFPPLDGYRIVEDLAPANIRPKLTRFEAYGSLIFLIIVITPLDQFIIHPIFNTVLPVIADWLNTLFYHIFM